VDALLFFYPHVSPDWKMKNVRRDSKAKRIVECGRKDSIGSNTHEIAADKFLDLLARLIARAQVREEPVGDKHNFAHGNRKQARRSPQKGIKRDTATQDRAETRSKGR
jgi:hypothetical protein